MPTQALSTLDRPARSCDRSRPLRSPEGHDLASRTLLTAIAAEATCRRGANAWMTECRGTSVL